MVVVVVLSLLVGTTAGGRIAAVVATDCVKPDFRSFREVGASFPASILALIHVKETFPSWESVLLTDASRWASGCAAVFREMRDDVYERRFPGSSIDLVSLETKRGTLLGRIQTRVGKETDHSRGHWPVEAYMHLLAPEILYLRGFEYAVSFDADVFFLDDSLASEVPKVRGVGCIAAIPPECLTNPKMRGGIMNHLRQEYRLVADATLLDAVEERARDLKFAFRARNTTNSGLVVYKTAALAALNWTTWIEALFDVSEAGFYGDQTALSVAVGRADLDVRWLPPKFNVALTLPKDYVRATCGPDARYSANAADRTAEIAAVHFVWGPKPWTSLMNRDHASTQRFAVQADLPFANEYRTFAKRILRGGPAARFFSPNAFDLINNSMTHVHRPTYAACDQSPHPCGRAPSRVVVVNNAVS